MSTDPEKAVGVMQDKAALLVLAVVTAISNLTSRCDYVKACYFLTLESALSAAPVPLVAWLVSVLGAPPVLDAAPSDDSS